MLKNQHGHFLPVSLIISFLFFMILAHQVNLYVLDKKFYYEKASTAQAENVMELAFHDIIKQKIVVNSPSNGIIVYPDGNASYSSTVLTSESSLIKIAVLTTSGSEYSVKFIYHFNEKKVTDWIDRAP